MFQSPNRVKPLSNDTLVEANTRKLRTFQSPNRVKPLSNATRPPLASRRRKVSIAQSRQTSFQLSGGICFPQCWQCFNRPIASNLFPTELQPFLKENGEEFQSPNRVKPLSNPKWPTRTGKPLQPSFNRPIASNLFPTNFDTGVPFDVNEFQSPNRVKPLSNVNTAGASCGVVACFNRPIASNLFPTVDHIYADGACNCVSIAQSRQTSFQPLRLKI